MNAAIILEKVSKYGVLEHYDLIVRSGERVLLRSNNTAILNIAAGMEKPDGGAVILLGTKISDLPEREAAAFRNSRIGYAGQDADLFHTLTVLENTALYLTIRGTSRYKRASAAREVLTLLGLSSVMHNYPNTLSLSQRRRSILARALVAEPEILLLGSLFTGLRESEAAELADYVNITFERGGFTMLICSAEVPSKLNLDREEMV